MGFNHLLEDRDMVVGHIWKLFVWTWPTVLCKLQAQKLTSKEIPISSIFYHSLETIFGQNVNGYKQPSQLTSSIKWHFLEGWLLRTVILCAWRFTETHGQWWPGLGALAALGEDWSPSTHIKLPGLEGLWHHLLASGPTHVAYAHIHIVLFFPTLFLIK